MRREQLIREQNETWTRMQEIMQRAADESRDLTAEEATNWEAANTRLDQIDGELRRLDAMEAREQIDRSQIVEGANQPVDPRADSRTPEQTAEEYREAFSAYLRDGMGSESTLTARQRELLQANRTEMRALGQGTPQAGGFLVPDDHDTNLRRVLDTFGGMLPYCHQITTATGAAFMWPVGDDTMNEGVEIAENTAVPEQDTTFDEREIGANTYTSKMVRVPWTLQQDAAFDLDGYLTTIFGERLGRVYAKRLLTGTGIGQPLGLLAPSRIGAAVRPLRIGVTTPTGATQAITFDNFIDLEHSIDPAYRNSGRARYQFSDGALKIARKVKDNDGRYLWQPVVSADGFPTINGYPYHVDNSMASPTANGFAAVFGDFYAGMLVRIVKGFTAVRLTERYAEFLQNAYFAYSRMDATPDDTRALAALRFGPAS